MSVKINPALDLILDRTIDVPVELVWKAWTEPEHLMPWFCPVPWKTIECEIDLRPGGRFMTVMQSPEGERFPSTGCYLEVVKHEKLVWTGSLGEDFRPNPVEQNVPVFTAILRFERKGNGTRYYVHAMHATPEGRDAHEKMGFTEGWGIALDQLVAYSKSMK